MEGRLHFPTAPIAGGRGKTRPKLYGRANDLKRLRAIYDRAAAAQPRVCGGIESESSVGSGISSGPNGCVLFVTGLAGVGKSALVNEFINANQVQSNRLARRRSSSDSTGHKLPFMHVTTSFVHEEAETDSDRDRWFSEFYDAVQAVAMKVSTEITAHRKKGAKSRGKKYQDSSSSSDDDSSSSDEDSICDDELFDSPRQRDAAPDSTCELDEIISAHKSKTKESLFQLMEYICKYVTQPFLMFFDNVDALDESALDVLSFLFRSPLPNSMLICACKAVDSAPNHPLNILIQSNPSSSLQVETMVVNPLSLDVITKFIADSIKKETHEVFIVAKEVYKKTMGVISYVIRALTESFDKKVLHYDSDVEDWRWEIKQVDLVTDYVSQDTSIIEFVNSRLNELPEVIQRMMTLMSCLSHDIQFQASLLVDIMEIGDVALDEKTLGDHLEWATREGFLASSYSSSNETYQFAHPIIREACQQFMPEEDRRDLSCEVFRCRFDKWNKQRPHTKWSKKEMAFLIEFLNLLGFSSGSRKPGNSRRNRAQLSKSVGPSVSSLSKEDGRDVRLSDCRVGAAPVPFEPKSRRPSRRTGTAMTLAKSMGDISKLQNLEISVPESTELSSKPTQTTMIELLSNRVTPENKPPNTTKKVIDHLFFPHITDPKSWLLKHGSVFVDRNKGTEPNSIDNERELMLFTHGFLVINVAMNDVFRLFFALEDQVFLTETAFMDYVTTKLDLDNTEGDIDGEKVYACFLQLAVSKPKNVVAALLENGNKLSPEEFQESLLSMLSNKLSPSLWQESTTVTKVESATLFSSVARLDNLSISHCNDPRSLEMHASDQADFSFSISLFDQEDVPLYYTFPTSEDRDSWLCKFGESVINAWENSSNAELLKMETRIGWQHLVVRASPITFVILNDHRNLEKCLTNNHVDLNLLDEFNGYSALHYATILGHTDCVAVLLRLGAVATLHDKDGLSPMIHAVALGHDEAADLIEAYGSKRKDAIKSVDEDEEIRKAAIKATSESLRSLELSDREAMQLDPADICISRPSCVSYPTPTLSGQRVEKNKSPTNSFPPKSHHNSKFMQSAPSILRGSHQKVQEIPRTTSLENFKATTIPARRVCWADVVGRPDSLRTLVTYELSESEDDGESSDDSAGNTDTSTTQGLTISDDEEDDDSRALSQSDKSDPEKLPASSHLLHRATPKHYSPLLASHHRATLSTINSISSEVSDQSDDNIRYSSQLKDAVSTIAISRRPSKRNQKAADMGRMLLSRPHSSLQSIHSNSSAEVSEQSDNNTEDPEPPINVKPITVSPSISHKPRRQNIFTATFGRMLLGRQKASLETLDSTELKPAEQSVSQPIEHSSNNGVTQAPHWWVSINPESLVPTRRNSRDISDDSGAANPERTLLSQRRFRQ